MKNILITGGAGFIGSHLTRHFSLNYSNYSIVNVDSLTYASNIEYIKELDTLSNYKFFKGDIVDLKFMKKLFVRFDFDHIIHLAAESHVDNSIKEPLKFTQTNVIGTVNLLNLANEFWSQKKNKLFFHVSTDEVYGSLGDNGSFTEESCYDPRSPYSASKASSDMFVKAYGHTFNLPYIISNCSNNFGPNQNNEKLIPVVIDSIKNNKEVPVYGNGMNIRDWLYVGDHVLAIDKLFHSGVINETFNIGGGNELRNIDLIKKIIKIVDKELSRENNYSSKLIKHIEDRKGHDYRYSVNYEKLSSTTGWSPRNDFDSLLTKTIKWYLR